jgi:hypothetical protein
MFSRSLSSSDIEDLKEAGKHFTNLSEKSLKLKTTCVHMKLKDDVLMAKAYNTLSD